MQRCHVQLQQVWALCAEGDPGRTGDRDANEISLGQAVPPGWTSLAKRLSLIQPAS